MLKRLNFLALLAGLCFAFFSSSPLHAQIVTPEDAENLVRIRILPETNQIKARQEFWVGVEQKIAPHWHTYWKNPGDSGAEPRIQWKTPDGFSVSDIVWPTPKKLPYGPLLNYGYEDTVILHQKIKAPQDLPEGAISLTADIEILVCKEECIPRFFTETLTLNDPQAMQEDNKDYLADARAQFVPTQNHVWTGTYLLEKADNQNNFILAFPIPEEIEITRDQLEAAVFYPEQWGLVDNPAPVQISVDDHSNNKKILILNQKHGGRPLDEVDEVSGILQIDGLNGKPTNLQIKATEKTTLASNATPAQKTEKIGLGLALAMAFLGGIILNFMPCVFPVLSLKALSLVKMSSKEENHIRMNGIVFTLGVLVMFNAIAAILIILKATGHGLGWGFHLQSPIAIALLVYLMFLIGLNLSGFFEIPSKLGNIGNSLTRGNNLSSTFFTGVLTTIVATPCTAPFMATAIGFALLQPAYISLSVFTALGLGLAFPYLIISFVPTVRKLLPKPGAWMETFRQFLAFPMFGFAVWLVWILAQQTNHFGLLGVLIGLVSISFGIWLLRVMPEKGWAKKTLQILACISFILPFLFLPVSTKAPASLEQESTSEKFGEVFSQDTLNQYLEGDNPVFIEMTAAWCITCKVNHALDINTNSTRATFEKYNISYLVGDWTNYDENITKYLETHGRNGVPLYVYYGSRNNETGERPEAEVLPQLLTPGTITEFIKTKGEKNLCIENLC